jgi:integrase
MSDGSVFVRRLQRGREPRWYVYAKVREGGRWRQRVLGSYERRRDADRAAEAARRRLRTGARFDAERTTLSDWCAAWLEAGDWRPKTRAVYEGHLRRHVLPHLGERRLGELRRSGIEAWLRHLEAEGRGQATISGAHRTLRAALAAAVRDGLIETNPAAAMRVRGPQTRAGAAWRAEQLAAFLAAAEGHRLWPLLRFLATTGARLGEAAGLCWDRVDLEAGVVTIDRALVWVEGRPTWSAPKSARGRRSVRLDAATVEVLRTWRADQAAERLAGGPSWGQGWREAALVFTAEGGGPVDPSNLRRVMRRLARAAGLPAELAVSPHALRHTVATLNLTAGQPPALVAATLGHDPAVLLRTYSHAAPDAAGVADTVAALLEANDRR